MKKFITAKYMLCLLTWCVCLTGVHVHGQALNEEEKLKLALLDEGNGADHRTITPYNAWLYYRSGIETNYRKADDLLCTFISLQDSVPLSKTFGQWAWSPTRPIGDLNVALFQSHDLLANLWEQQDKMSGTTRARYLTSCRRLLEAARRRWDTEIFDLGRDFVAYSNIFCLYIQTLTLAADRFNDPLLYSTAQSQWTRWYNHFRYYGIDEFASLTYNNVVFKALIDIHDYCHDERIEKETREVMDHVYMLQSAITHPLLKMPVAGISRDYRLFLKQADARCPILITPQNDYTPPAQAVAINTHRRYPFTVIGKAAFSPFIFKSYQLEDAAMGSMTGGNCFEQQIHCLVAVGKSETERAVVFIQGTNTPMNGYTDQKETSTLCVYNRLPTLWHLTEWRGDRGEYRQTFEEFGIGLSKWREKSVAPDHIVLEAYGYELHLFPFMLRDQQLTDCRLTLMHRTNVSPRYHPRPLVFDEYVFPAEPEWFGVHVVLVKSGVQIKKPQITCSIEKNIYTFKSKQGHQVKLYVTEQGDTRQLHNVDPTLIPLLEFSE
jgi:hypothetical protein